MSIRLKNLTIKNKVSGFEDLNFTFEYGKLYFCHGVHGIGKSSLVNSIVGLSTPLKGEILYGDVNFYKDVRDKRYEIRQEMGVIFDKPGLLSNLTVYENLKLRFLALKKENRFNGYRDEKFDEIIMNELKKLDLENKKDLRPFLLSQGEIKKVSISRALLSKPKIIIWDDAFDGLSDDDKVFYEAKILNLLEENSLIILFNSWVSFKDKLVSEVVDLNGWRKKIG